MNITKETFTRLVQERIAKDPSVMSCIIEVLRVLEIPIEDAGRYVDQNLMASLEREAISLHMVKGSDKPSIEDFM
jgi:hypothetical protein